MDVEGAKRWFTVGLYFAFATFMTSAILYQLNSTSLLKLLVSDAEIDELAAAALPLVTVNIIFESFKGFYRQVISALTL